MPQGAHCNLQFVFMVSVRLLGLFRSTLIAACSLDFHGCLLLFGGRDRENEFNSVLCNNIYMRNMNSV